jgi:hypothetical protein
MVRQQSRFRDWPDPARLIGDEAVELRLEYWAYIPTDNRQGDHHSDLKHAMRLEFSNQLRIVWRKSPMLNQHQHFIPPSYGIGSPIHFPEGFLWEEHPRRSIFQPHYRPEDDSAPFFQVQMCGFSWVPLVSWHNYLNCKLDITFHGEGQSAVRRGGDLDNRVKTLFDGLRMPLRDSEVPGNMFGKNAELAYCLLEDDSLIREFTVRSVTGVGSPVEHGVQVIANIGTMDGYEPHPALERFR